MRVVVTGGSGRLGQYVIRELCTHSHAVSSLDSIKPRECLCPTYTVDLTKFDRLIDHCKNADALVHLARIRFPYTETGFNAAKQQWEFNDLCGDAERFNQNIAMPITCSPRRKSAASDESFVVRAWRSTASTIQRPNCCPIIYR